MPPKKPQLSEFELFQSRLDNMLDPEHPLVKLAGLIDWSRFDAAFGRFYTQKGRPGLPTRLIWHSPALAPAKEDLRVRDEPCAGACWLIDDRADGRGAFAMEHSTGSDGDADGYDPHKGCV